MFKVCRKKAEHLGKYMKFCTRCAQTPNPKSLLYCEGCEGDQYSDKLHGTHSNDHLISSKKILQLLAQFRKDASAETIIIFSCDLEYTNQVGKILDIVIDEIKNDPSFISRLICQQLTFDIIDAQIFSDLVKFKFWKSRDRIDLQGFRNLLQDKLCKFPRLKEIVDNPSVLKIQRERNSFKVMFDETFLAIQADSIIQESDRQLIALEQQKQLTKLFIQVYTAFNNKDVEKAKKACQTLKNKGREYNQFIIELGLLKLCEFDPKGPAELINQMLNMQVPTNKCEKELYHYFKAAQCWSICSKAHEGIRFHQAYNHKSYYLQCPAEFNRQLIEAMSCEKKPIFYALRGMSYLAQKKFENALSEFSMANKLGYQSDSLTNNRNYCLVKLDRISPEEIMHRINQRSAEFIANAAKYFKKKKNYQRCTECCQILVEREPKNKNYKISLVKSLVNQDVERFEDRSKAIINKLRKADQITEEQFIELDRLITRKLSRKSLEMNEASLENQLYLVAMRGKPSATAYFNYASFMYAKGEYKATVIEINKAIELRRKQCYLLLKYYALFYSGEFQLAKELQGEIKDPEDRLRPMKDYIAETLV